uniref:Protein containing DUF169 n=1 Tax=uncultured microorganism TaxID=358574 RepID=F8UHQ6_9ZZZZ|nr:protein containing DUF169 [uncultured microorganism]
MNAKFSEKFSSQWIKVKFYQKDPRLDGVTQPKNIRFCEAVKLAVTQPVILSKENLSCESAQYVFGWRKKFNNQLLDSCQDKCKVSDKVLQSLLSGIPRLKKSFSHIGLNTDEKPDLVISCVAPQEMMKIIKVYNNHNGKNIEVSLNSMMGLCGNIAVKSFLEEKISISFGCLDSRKFAEIGRNRLAVGIPRKLFKVFI